MTLQAQKRSDGKADVIALRHRSAVLGALHTTELLEAAMVRFDGSNLGYVIGQRFQGAAQVIGRPVFHATVWGSYLEYANDSIEKTMISPRSHEERGEQR